MKPSEPMPKLVQIHDVPDAVHQEMKRRAARLGVSLSAFLRAELALLAEQEPLDEVMERIRANAKKRGFRPEEPPAITIRRRRDARDAPGPADEAAAEAIRRRRDALG